MGQSPIRPKGRVHFFLYSRNMQEELNIWMCLTCCSRCMSLSAALQLEVSLELQFKDVESLNLTLWGLRNHNSLHLQPPKDEDDNKGWNVEEGGEVKAFYCCSPAPVSSESTTQSQCLLWLPNQTALTWAAHHQPPLADKGQCWGQKSEEIRDQFPSDTAFI